MIFDDFVERADLLSTAVGHYTGAMIKLRFAAAATEKRALGFLAGRFSFRSSVGGITLVTEQALPALARENIPFIVDGQASYEQIVAALRDPAASSVQ